MVPQFKAKAAFEMLHRFLRNEKLQKYDPKAKVSSHLRLGETDQIATTELS